MRVLTTVVLAKSSWAQKTDTLSGNPDSLVTLFAAIISDP
jgi:hypothetical protein